jgi:hypothetical protein
VFQLLKNFGAGGLATDPFEENASPVQWSQLDSVDMIAGDMASPGQDITLAKACPITPKWMFAYTADFTDYLFVTDGFAVWSTSGGQWTKLVDGWHGGLVTFTVFLGSLVINSYTDGPFYWPRGVTMTQDIWGLPTPPDSTNPVLNVHWQDQPLTETWNSTTFDALLALPGWFLDATCLQIVAYKNFLVAIGVRDPARSSDIEPYLICWSDAAPAGGVPGSWDPLPTNLAGDTLAQDTPGSLSAADIMRDDLVIYKTDGQVYRLTFVGGNLVMNLQRLYQGFGVAYPGAVASLSGIHYLATRSGIMAFDGQTMQALDFARIQESVRELFKSADGEVSLSCAYPGRKQIWTAYRQTGTGPYFGILKYDVEQNVFTVHDYSGENLTSICPGRIGSTFSGPVDTWVGGDDIPWDAGGSDSWQDGNEQAWNAESTIIWLGDEAAGVPNDSADPWDKGIGTPLQDTMFLAVGEGVIARYDPRGTSLRWDGVAKTCKATRYGIRLGENPSRQIIRGIYPLAKGPGKLKVTVGKSWAPWQDGGPVEVQWGPERTFTPGVDRMIPLRMIGDSFAIQIANDDGERWTLGGIGVEFDQLGRRG